MRTELKLRREEIELDKGEVFDQSTSLNKLPYKLAKSSGHLPPQECQGAKKDWGLAQYSSDLQGVDIQKSFNLYPVHF